MIVFLSVKVDFGISKVDLQLQFKTMKTLSGPVTKVNIVLTS
jgi:hypothetical protein